MDARLDKYFFQNLVKYNEQPYGELVAANFFELDFSPKGVNHYGTFDTLREKIVLDLTVKVLQVQQRNVITGLVTPILPGLTPPVVLNSRSSNNKNILMRISSSIRKKRLTLLCQPFKSR